MDSVHVADTEHSANGRRIGTGLELLAVVVGFFSLMVLFLQLQAVIAVKASGANLLGVAWIFVLLLGIAMGILGIISLVGTPHVHAIGILAIVMAMGELLANLVQVEFRVLRMLEIYPQALAGQFGTEAFVAAARFPLTLFIAVLYVLWLFDHPRKKHEHAL